MQHLEDPEVWHARLTEPLPGRVNRVSARVERQEANDFARLAGMR